ncbi:uncharacterized protein LOC116266607 [Nymphaea colorata]|nr:uncharacterized protein LOC116266607 [Nymphaea colorata]
MVYHGTTRNSLPRDPELSLPSTYLFLCSSCVSTPRALPSPASPSPPPSSLLLLCLHWRATAAASLDSLPVTDPRPTDCACASYSGPTTSESGGFSYTLWWCFWAVLLHANRQQQLKPSSSVHLRPPVRDE